MSTKSFTVTVVSAKEQIFSAEADFVVLPGEAGDLGILPGHIPLLTRLRPGMVRIEPRGGNRDDPSDDSLVFVSGGLVEVRPDQVTVLADTAMRGKDIDEARAQEARKYAQEAIANNKSGLDFAQAQSELSIALAQIAALRKLKEKRR